MRRLSKGLVWVGLAGVLAAFPGGASALSQFEVSADIFVRIGANKLIWTGPPTTIGGSPIVTGSILYNPNGGQASGTGGTIVTSFQPGSEGILSSSPTFTSSYDPNADAGGFNNWASGQGSVSLAGGRKVVFQGTAQDGGGYNGANIPPFGGMDQRIRLDIVNADATPLVLDFVGIPNLLASADADPGETANVRSVVNYIFSSNLDVNQVEVVANVGDTTSTLRNTQAQNGYDFVSFSNNVEVDETGLETAFSSVPAFSFFTLNVPGNSESYVEFQFFAIAELTSVQQQPPSEAIPLPGALPLMAAAMAGFGWLRLRRRGA